MSISKALLTEALNLKPADRFVFIQALNESLDKPDDRLDNVWLDEVLKRMEAYESGKIEAISFEEFKSL